MNQGVGSEENLPSYILITPARNEEAFIELTIKSMVVQTVLPIKWVIVSDGSTDGTDHIIKKYAAQYEWIEFVRTPERAERHFAGKVNAFNAGYQRVKDLNYDIIGNLDADISFEENYFAFILSKFRENSRLGVGGTPFKEGLRQYDYRFASIEHVSGACQLFRRECFESIGGYLPRKIGGIDLVAVLTARMKGWQTMSFLEKACIHHRKMGTGTQNKLMVNYSLGRADYILGTHPLWETIRCIYHMKNKPFIICATLLLVGFYWAMLTRVEKDISQELEIFRKKEQLQRLKIFLSKFLSL